MYIIYIFQTIVLIFVAMFIKLTGDNSVAMFIK